MAKGIIKDLLSQGEMNRPAFIPLIHCYAAKLVQLPVRNILTSPTLMTKAISMAFELFHHDAITFPIDTTLEVEALGATIELGRDSPPRIRSHPFASSVSRPDTLDTVLQRGRMPVAFETIKRLKAQLAKDADILAGVTGPLTLAFHLRGEHFSEECRADQEKAADLLEFTSQVTTRVIRAYGEIGVDGILLFESCFSQSNMEMISLLKSFCMSTANTCNYYELPVISYLDGIPDQGGDLLFTLPWQGFILHDPANLSKNVEELLKDGRCLGHSLSPHELESETGDILRDNLKKYVNQGGSTGFFISTTGDPSHNTPVKNFHEIMSLLKSDREC